MNKQELVSALSEKISLSKVKTQEIVDAFVEVVTEELEDGGSVSIMGFGIFSVRDRAARKGRNPQTGKEIKIAAKTVPVFKAGAKLKKAVE